MAVLSSLLMALAIASAVGVDPYVQAKGGELLALLQSAQLGEPGADARLEEWLRTHPAATEAERKGAYHRLCQDYEVRSNHAAAAGACAQAAGLGADDGQSAAINASLREVPAIRAIGSARLTLTLNPLGNRDATVTVNGVSAPWVMDTGAQISVVSRTLADQIGIRRVGKPIAVGAVTTTVHGDLGVIDLMQVGDATVENVPVLVLPDAQLKIADLPQIRAILGLPVYVAFRRAAWLDQGATLALGESAPPVPPSSPRLYWNEQGVGVPVSTALGTRGALLDSGANDTTLWPAAHGLLSLAIEAAAAVHRVDVGGAGGVVVHTRQTEYPTIALSIAGAPLVLHKISLADDAHDGVARVGDDAIRQLSLLDFDFETMRVLAVPAPAK